MDNTTGVTNPHGKPATPQQQKQFDLILGRARQLMESAGKEWISSLKIDPVHTAVKLGVSTLRELEQSSTQAGQAVDPTVMFQVGIQFVKDIANVANAAGVLADDAIPAFLKDVFSQAMAEYLHLDAKDGLIKQKGAEGMLAKMQGGQAEQNAPADPDTTGQPDPDAAQDAQETAQGLPDSDADSDADDPEMANQLAMLRKQRGG